MRGESGAMTITQARIALERAARAAPFPIMFKSAFGVGLVSLTTFEVVASFIPYHPSDAVSIGVALAGLVTGTALALWR